MIYYVTEKCNSFSPQQRSNNVNDLWWLEKKTTCPINLVEKEFQSVAAISQRNTIEFSQNRGILVEEMIASHAQKLTK